MRAVLNEKFVAESDETVVVEGNQGFPVDAVAAGAAARGLYTHGYFG